MKPFRNWILAVFVLPLAACSSTAHVSSCDGWAKLNPSAETRRYVIENDRPFAQGVAGHNSYGSKRRCW